jgi:alanine-synthesizing transaminase
MRCNDITTINDTQQYFQQIIYVSLSSNNMRVRISHPGAGELRYEIRSIVSFAKKLQDIGVAITWENIGDPVAKGEEVPNWIREIVANEVMSNNDSFGYSPTKGLLEARNYIASSRTYETGIELSPENIIFFNGLGDAIHEVYSWLSPYARVLGPNPAYPTHASIEGAHARSQQITYLLDPNNHWLPDMKDVRDKVHFDDSIVGLLIINPDNPTGMVYPRSILEQFVALAMEYNLFLIADEIYAGLTYSQKDFISLASLAGSVPTMILRGLSKEVPWPGSRCGWVEFYNTNQDTDYATYIESIENAKMNEVCSTTLPQTVLPKILSDARYGAHLQNRRKQYMARAKIAASIFKNSKYLCLVEPKGAFYLTVTFSEDFALSSCRFPKMSIDAQQLLSEELAKDQNMATDKAFCLRLLASTGICVVPLSSEFNSHTQGFRMTLLEQDSAIFLETLNTIISVVGD